MNREKVIGLVVICIVMVLGIGVSVTNHAFKAVVVKEIQSALDADVSLGSARLALYPFGVTLRDFSVVDSKQPDILHFNSKKITLTLQFSELLKGNFIINNMVVMDANNNVSREFFSKKLKKPVQTQHDVPNVVDTDSETSLTMLQESLLSNLLQSQQLSGEAYVADLLEKLTQDQVHLNDDALLSANQEHVQQTMDSLINIKESLNKTDLLGIETLTKQLESLVANTNQQQQVVMSQKEKQEALYNVRKKEINDMVTYFDADYRLLQESVQLDTYDSTNFSESVLKEMVSGYLDYYLYYSKLASRVLYNLAYSNNGLEYVSENKGRSIAVNANKQMPRVWIKKLVLSQSNNPLSIKVYNISSNQSFVGKPVRFQFNDGEKQIYASYFVGKTLTQVYSITYSPFSFKTYPVYQDLDNQIILNAANQDIAANVEIVGNRMSGNIYFNTTQINVLEDHYDHLSLSQLVYDSLKTVENVVTKVSLSGTSRKPVMDIASDFDLLVEDRFNQAMTLEKERKLTLLKQSITLRKDLEQSRLVSMLEQTVTPALDRVNSEVDRLHALIDDMALVKQDIVAKKDALLAIQLQEIENKKRQAAFELQQKQEAERLALEKAKQDAAAALETTQELDQSVDVNQSDAAINNNQSPDDAVQNSQSQKAVSLELSQNL
ncbi:hypothetical protein CL657_00955 [bacterium]|nr:hypothetical protein [bacterium]